MSKQAELVGSFTISGGNHKHVYHGHDDDTNPSVSGVDTEGNGLHYAGNNYYTDYSGNLTFTRTATENRPANYTYRIWKRIA